MNDAASPRLLFLMNMFENALRDREAPAVAKPPARMVSFHRGIGRLSFHDGSGDVTVQSFTLADGQQCLKIILHWPGTDYTSAHSLYPQGNFQWEEAVGQVADVWLEGPPAAAVAPASTPAAGMSALGNLEAAG